VGKLYHISKRSTNGKSVDDLTEEFFQIVRTNFFGELHDIIFKVNEPDISFRLSHEDYDDNFFYLLFDDNYVEYAYKSVPYVSRPRLGYYVEMHIPKVVYVDQLDYNRMFCDIMNPIMQFESKGLTVSCDGFSLLNASRVVSERDGIRYTGELKGAIKRKECLAIVNTYHSDSELFEPFRQHYSRLIKR
jgi:hypothetical protein